MKPTLDITFSRTPLHGSDDIVILEFSGKYWDDIYYFPKQYQIGIIEAGNGTFTVGETAWNLAQGDVFYIAPNLVHKGKPDPNVGWKASILNIAPHCIEPLLAEVVTLPQFHGFTPFPLHAEAFHQLLSDFDSTNSLEEALQLVFAYLISTSDSANPHHQGEAEHWAVSKARRYIEAHFTTKISLDEIADEACLSKFHLLRVFKEETGLAPITYQLHLRLNASRNLMFLEKSLTEIAYTLGFTDQSHFINTYKKYAHITPKTLQKTAIFSNFSDVP